MDMFKREFIKKTVVAGAGIFWTPGVFAEILQQTPPQMEGSFYPDKMPLDTDNDLLIVGDSINLNIIIDLLSEKWQQSPIGEKLTI